MPQQGWPDSTTVTPGMADITCTAGVPMYCDFTWQGWW
ncbi:Uncharacterised protein [Mycobacteroides abscessus subsp. abscessus]|nr:Uncharacterised protein [Mycobacteroides abscessus subsp. abscessus]